jgi:hypothetical protein
VYEAPVELRLSTFSSPRENELTDADRGAFLLSARGSLHPVRLVPARRASAIRSNEARGVMSVQQARWLFTRCAADDSRRMRDFVVAARLGSPSPHAMSDAELRRWIVDRIDSGALIALQHVDSENGPAASPWAPLRKLAAQIEESAPGGFRLAGFHFRVVAGVDLLRIEDRDLFELASREEARRILSELSQQRNTSPAAVPLLAKAKESLSSDWRPPLEPDGLVVLRRKLMNRTTRPTNSDIVTPSQMVPRVEKT